MIEIIVNTSTEGYDFSCQCVKPCFAPDMFEKVKAAVSGLCIALREKISQQEKERTLKIERNFIKPGNIEISVRYNDDCSENDYILRLFEGSAVIETIECGLIKIAESYPDYIKLTVNEH